MNRVGTSKSSPSSASTANQRLVLPRREFLQVGGLGSLSVTLPGFLATRLPAATGDDPVTTQRSNATSAKSLIFVFLYGGPPHQDIFDMKPDAPVEVRGEFKPIRTNVPGIEICEHLPQLAQRADKFALVRSVPIRWNGTPSGLAMAEPMQQILPGECLVWSEPNVTV